MNDFDLDGKWKTPGWAKAAAGWAKSNPDAIVAGAAFGICIVATVGACGAVSLGAAAISGGIVAAQSYRNDRNWRRAALRGTVSFAIDASFGRATRGVKVVRNFGRTAARYAGGQSVKFSARAAGRMLFGGGHVQKRRAWARLGIHAASTWGGYKINQWGMRRVWR